MATIAVQVGFLWLIVQLPYPVLYRLGNSLGRLSLRFMKRRAKIAYRNLELCFPEKTDAERHQMVVKNFESVGMGVIETGIAWYWPDQRLRRIMHIQGDEHVRERGDSADQEPEQHDHANPDRSPSRKAS